jgi:tetratricopeptide (TPR) repeat protein
VSSPAAITLAAFETLPPEARVAAISADPRGVAAAVVALGDECERLAAGSSARALSLGESLHGVALELGAASAAARALRATVPAIAYLGQLEQSLVRAAEARTLASGAGDAVEAARADVASIHALTKLGRTDEAIRRGNAARDALVAAGRSDLAARAELNLANVHKVRGEHQLSIQALERALAGVGEADRVARGTILNTLGETLLQLDRFDDARRAFDDAEPLLAGLGLAQAIVAGNKADMLARQGQLGDSIRAFERAASMAAPLAPGHHARLLIEEAEALAVLGAHREALASIEAALRTAQDKGLKAEMARALLVRARVLAAADAREESDAAAGRALDIANEMSDTRTARKAALVRGETALRAGKPTRARELAAFARLGASPLEEAQADALSAAAMLLAGEPRAARIEAKRASTAARELGVRTVEIDCIAVHAACHRALGDTDAAVALLSRAVELAEELRGALVAERHRAAFASTRLRVYEELALELLARDDRASLEQAFIAVERARSRLLLDAMLRAIERLPSADAGPQPELAALRARLSALHARGLDAGQDGAQGERRGIPPSVLSEMRALEQSIDALVLRLQSSESPAAGIGSLFARPLGVAEIAARLEPTDALIAYFEAGDEVLAFSCFEGNLVCTRALASAEEVADLVDKLLFLLRAGVRGEATARPSASLEAIARALHARLMAPVLAAHSAVAKRATRLVVVPFGALHALPFAMLDDGRDKLIEKFELHLAPSASIACMPARDRDGGDALVVGVADAHAPLIDDEVAAVASRCKARVVAGDDATIGAFRAAARGARVVHLACHGRFVPSLPSASGVRLADGWMPLRDIVGLGLDADLVFLSGCETGRHAVDIGDELAGIARAFLAGGARRLVTTLWSVRDAAAIEVATRFHDGFSRGSRPSSALRAAMLASLRNRVHPSWWAPFVTTGVL